MRRFIILLCIAFLTACGSDAAQPQANAPVAQAASPSQARVQATATPAPTAIPEQTPEEIHALWIKGLQDGSYEALQAFVPESRQMGFDSTYHATTNRLAGKEKLASGTFARVEIIRTEKASDDVWYGYSLWTFEKRSYCADLEMKRSQGRWWVTNFGEASMDDCKK